MDIKILKNSMKNTSNNAMAAFKSLYLQNRDEKLGKPKKITTVQNFKDEKK